MQSPGQLGPAGGIAIIANPHVMIVNIVKDNDEYNPNFNVLFCLISEFIL